MIGLMTADGQPTEDSEFSAAATVRVVPSRTRRDVTEDDVAVAWSSDETGRIAAQ